MRNPSWYEDPPEDPPETTPEEDADDFGDYLYERKKDKDLDDRLSRELPGPAWDTPRNAPYNDKDCDYWRNLK